MNENTVHIGFDCRPRTWHAIADTIGDLVRGTNDETATTKELWNVVNQIRSSLQHHVVEEMQRAAAAKETDDWL